MCRRGTGRARVSRETAAAWEHDVDKLFELAVANLSGDAVTVEMFELADPVQLELHHAHGEHDLVASLALRLSSLTGPAHHGWLFLVPHGRSL